MEEFFDDCIEEVVDMVRYHIDEIENRGSEPDVSERYLHT